MSNNTKNPSILAVLAHVFLTLITGGFWLVVLLIWYVLKNK
jgi:hypothetical protein